MDGKLGKKQLLLGAIFAIILLPVVGLTVFLFTKPQNTSTKANQPLPTTTVLQSNTSSVKTAQAVCTPPGQVTNVKVNYPNCQ